MIEVGFDKESKFIISDISKIFKTLTKNLYPRPLESTVIEIVSNARDSMNKCGKNDEPIFFSYNEETREVSVKDFGVGMSPEFMNKHYTDIGYSDKGEDITSIGQFGLGRLAVLSYTESFIVKSIYDGVESTYLISSNEYDTPDINEICSEETSDSNGVEVIFKLKDNRSEANNWWSKFRDRDLISLQEIIETKLPFFDNIIYKNLDIPSYVNYDYKNFKVTTNITGASTKILYKNCIYPINTVKINNKYQAGLFLKFDDSVKFQPTPDRSSIQWDNYSIDVVRKKLEEVRIEINSIFNTQKIEFKNPFEWKHKLDSFKYNKCVLKHDVYIPINITKDYLYKGRQIKTDPRLYFYDKPFFSIKKFRKRSDFITLNFDTTYFLKEEDCNKYKRNFPQYSFCYLNLDKKIYDTTLSVKDPKDSVEDFKYLSEQAEEFLRNNLKSAYDLVIPKKTSNRSIKRQSRKNQIRGKATIGGAQYWIDKSTITEQHYYIQTNTLDTPGYYERTLLNLFRLKPIYLTNIEQLKKKDVKLKSWKEMLSSPRFSNYYNKTKYKVLIKKTLYDLPHLYNKLLSTWCSHEDCKSTTVHLSLISALDGYQDFLWEDYTNKTIDKINQQYEKYSNIYKYLYKQLKKRKCLN